MAKQLNVNLNFTANASQAQQTLNSLQANLTQIAAITPVNGVKLTQDLEIAKQSAKDLQQHLINAFNVKTGNLDLSKLDASLKSSGQSLGTLSANLLKAGTTGQQAFLNIQRSIGQASVQINQANGLLTQFWTTLKNTARWQISSSILHGMVSGLQSAWGYAKDLDKSLNNIRIVTGYSAEKMGQFAEKANAAAKALNTTTTEYTNASLIYYQQGLSDKEVLERTDITIKMANVTGESAQKVSDQLTAIWNNFDDGSKSLEYYVDVITALGASTASSTDEISQGLEKFAAVAETAGLSYEYATAALATVTAETRQSADVVGTAFKTLFARIQGLKLGETLDDGTTLNSYSEALMKVGINIKDANGELKDMDTILSEMGSKWNTLSSDQQVALAQAVGGIRQYNQLIALMDNWDVFENNLNTISNSTGALQEQADIYGDSWQAAVNRVKSAAEGIYQDLLPTDQLTDLADGFAVFLEGIDGVVQGLGGIEGVLLLISSIVLNVFQNQIGTAIDNITSKVVGGLGSAFNGVRTTIAGVRDHTITWRDVFDNITIKIGNTVASTQLLSNRMQEVRDATGNAADQMAITNQRMATGVDLATRQSMEMTKVAYETNSIASGFALYNTNLMEINNLQDIINQSSRYLTKEQQEQLSLLQQQALAANEQVLAAEDVLTLAQQRVALSTHAVGDDISNINNFRVNENEVDTPITNFDSGLYANGSNLQDVREMNTLWQQITGSAGDAAMTVEAYKGHVSMALGTTTDLEAINQEVQSGYGDIYTVQTKINDIMSRANKTQDGKVKLTKQEEKDIANIVKGLSQQNTTAGKVVKHFTKGSKTVTDWVQGLNKAGKGMKTFSIATGSSAKQIQGIEKDILAQNQALNQSSSAAENLKNKIQQVTTSLSNALNGAMSFGKTISGMASGFSTVAMGISSVVNFMETLDDESASFTTKLTSGAMAATMGISALMTVMKGLGAVIGSVTLYTNLKTAADLAGVIASEASSEEEKENARAQLENLLVTKLGVKEKKKKAVANGIVKAAQSGETGATLKDTIANWANVASQAAKLWYVTLIIAAIGLLIGLVVLLCQKEDKEAEAVKAANEQLKQAEEAYTTAANAANAFKEAVSDYDEAIEGLKNLKAGTQEMADAVADANEKAMKLIETYGLWNDYTYGVNGEIIIDESALNEAKARLEGQEARAKAAVAGAQIRKHDADLDLEARNIGQQIKYRYGRDEIYNSETGGYEYKAVAADSDNADYVYETAVAKDQMHALGSAVDIATEQLGYVPKNASELIAAIEANSGAYGLSENILANLNNVINDDTYGTILRFNASMDEAAAAAQYYADQILKAEVENNYGDEIAAAATNDEGKVDEVLADNMTNAVNAITKDAEIGGQKVDDWVINKQKAMRTDVLADASTYDAANNIENSTSDFVYETVYGKKGDGGGNDGDAWIKENYNKIFEGTDMSYDGNINTAEMAKAVYGSNGNQLLNVDDKNGKLVVTYKDASGEEHETTISNEQMQKQWSEAISNYAISSAAGKAQLEAFSEADAEKLLNNVADNSTHYGADFSNAIFSGIANGGQFDFSALYGEIDPTEYANMMAMEPEELTKMFGLDETMLAQLGFNSSQEFYDAFAAGMDGWGQFHAEQQIESLKALGAQYESCAEELKAYEEALASGKGVDAAAETLQAAITIGEAAKQYELDAEELEIQAQGLAEAYRLSAEEAANLAIKNQRMNKGIDQLKSNWGKWEKQLRAGKLDKAAKGSWDYAASIADLTDAFKDLIGVSDDYEIPEGFFESENVLTLMEEAANGSAKAVALLGIEAAKASVKTLEFDYSLKESYEAASGKAFGHLFNDVTKSFEDNKSIIMAGFDELFTAIETGAISAGDSATMLGDDWIASMNDMALQTGMSVTEMQDMLNSMGVSAKVEVKDVKQKVKVPVYETITQDLSTDEEKAQGITRTTTQTTQVDTKEMDGVVQVASIASDGDPATPDVKYTGTGSGGGSPSSSSGGGGSSKKKADTKKKSDIVDRYKEVSDKLDDNTDAMNKASKAADKLYGPDRLKKMREVNKLLLKEIGLLKEKREEAETNLELDKQDLNKAAAEAGIEFTIDEETGNITNYTTAMESLYNRRKDLLNSFGETIDDDEQKQLDDLDAIIEKVKDALSQYEETRELIEDIDTDIEDKISTWQDNNYEMLNIELELKITIDDSDLELIEYYLGKLEGDFYSLAEAAGYWTDKIAPITDKLSSQETYVNDLEKQYTTVDPETGETYINQSQYIDGLKNSQSEIISNLQALQELDDTMMHYYEDTLAAASEELSKYTDRMEHQAAVLDHYASIMELLGHSLDYEAMGVVLQGQADVAENAYEVSKANYEMLADEVRKKEEAYMNATTEEEKELIKKEWDAAIVAANEAQDQMLSDAEAWAESLKAVLENKLAKAGQALENALTGAFGSFDAMQTAMDRANSLQEEYLTTTNKIYETNKLIRNAQKEIDKTTNQAAKNKMKQFINETAALQEQGKLSQYELDIQQAKYDLLLAEIALKEAQNAKSTVRLQRDSEGNFGYVYTADQTAIGDAQQKFDDAQNALYNKGLDGANDYVQKYQQTMQEMYDTLTEIQTAHANGEYETEAEYNAAMESAKEYYYAKLEDYSRLYSVATTADSRVIADAWSTDFADMTTKTEDWKKAVSGYTVEVTNAFTDWEKATAKIANETIGKDLETLKNKTESVVTENEKLTQAIVGEDGVIDAMQDVIDEVSKATRNYALQRTELKKLEKAYENLLEDIKATITEMSKVPEEKEEEEKPEKKEEEKKEKPPTEEPPAAPTIKVGGKVNANGAKIYGWTGDTSGERQYFNSDPVYQVLAEDGDWIKVRHHSLSSGVTGWFKKADVTALNTGGYTGDWSGSYGKLAFLHQKELVLNAQDTENLLASMEFLHKVLEIIDLQSISNQLGGILSSPNFNHNNSSVIEQDVHIEASFPNVTNHSEIEEAFNNLINTASQYANRK